MLPQQSAKLLLRQISALDEVIDEPISQNIPVKILLHMFVEETSSKDLNQHKLNLIIGAPASTFERYVNVMASAGLIKTSQSHSSEQAQLSLPHTVRKRLETVFDPAG